MIFYLSSRGAPKSPPLFLYHNSPICQIVRPGLCVCLMSTLVPLSSAYALLLCSSSRYALGLSSPLSSAHPWPLIGSPVPLLSSVPLLCLSSPLCSPVLTLGLSSVPLLCALPAVCCISLSYCTLPLRAVLLVHVCSCSFVRPGQMCKDNLVTLSTHTPSNSRDVHHMTPVTNQGYVTCIM